jgi:cytochrome c553
MTRALLFMIAMLAAASVFARGDAAAGADKAQQVCAACHGPTGDKPLTPEFPKIGGQHYDYLYYAMRAYKTGQRKNAIMAAQVQALSDKELQDLAAYFSSQPGSLRVIR